MCTGVRVWACAGHYLVWNASVTDEQQVFQVRVEQRTVDHGDAQPLLHDEAHRAVVGESDRRRRLLEPWAAEIHTSQNLTERKHF